MFEEFDDFMKDIGNSEAGNSEAGNPEMDNSEVGNPEVDDPEAGNAVRLSYRSFHIVDTDDPENLRLVGGVPELWARMLDGEQGDNVFGIKQNCGVVSVSNIERMAGLEHVTETSTSLRAIFTGNCQFNLFDIGGSGGTTMLEQEALLEQKGIEASVYQNDEADLERIAEWVENGHGVILEHSTYLSAESYDFHLTMKEASQMAPGLTLLKHILPDDCVVTISEEGVDIETDNASVHMTAEEVIEKVPEIAEVFSGDVSFTVTKEGVDGRLTGAALENLAAVDEYGTVQMDHAATVTGTERDVGGNLLGLRICDSGWGESDRFISVERLEACYTNVYGGGVVVTDNPIHENGVPLSKIPV